MAEKSKLEFRDQDGSDDGAYLTKSNAQLDLERRQAEDYKPDSSVGIVSVNPNPFGEDEYVGTDPIYQNYANEQNKPFASEEGAEADAEEAYRESHKVDEKDAVEDNGLGGVASKAQAGTAARTYRTLVPGQEGYDRKKAEAQQGPPLRVYNDEENDSKDEVASATKAEPPKAPASPAKPSEK